MKSTEEFIKDLFLSRQVAQAGQGIDFSPSQRLVLSFFCLIALGTALLMMPWSHAPGQVVRWVDAVFTATSAVCVTGLIVQDTATAFSPFGQMIILFLIKLGGLGYMILATTAAVLLGRRIGMSDRAAIKQALNLDTVEGMGRFLRSVLVFSLSLEISGAIIIAGAYWPEYPLGKALSLGVFHSVSGFNNAGFSLFSNNLMGSGYNQLVVITIAGLATLGGLGFFVYQDVMEIILGKRKKLSLHTKLVLTTTLSLLVLGAIGVWLTAKTSWGQAFFLSAMARTAGFNIQSIGSLSWGTLFLLMPLMFIGASPGGTGGGIKTTTFALILIAVWTTLRGKNNYVAFKRQIEPEIIFKAFLIVVSLGLVLVSFTLLLVVWENQPVFKVLFEMVSALGTVGLSTGNGGALSLSAGFSDFGKIVVVLGMFIGRLGPLTLGLAAAFSAQHPQVKYPEGRVSIG